jgi:multidrug resistance efflux pump
MTINLEVTMDLKTKHILKLITLILVMGLVGCEGLEDFEIMAPKEEGIKASGVVETISVVVSPEMAGRVSEVFIDEGDQVTTGQSLFQLEDDLLLAQRQRAVAALETAIANLAMVEAGLESGQAVLEAAESSVEVAQIHFDMVLSQARQEVQPDRVLAWEQDNPDEFNTPVWYFDKTEVIAAAEAEVGAAWDTLLVERENYQSVLEEATNADLEAAEERLVEAQAAFLVAEELLEREISQVGEEQISDYIQDLYDSAKAELERAQKTFDTILTDQAYEDVLEARARVTVAQERYDIALDRLNELQTGDQSLQVQAAEATLNQAVLNVTQAQTNLAQAETGVTQAEKVVAQAQADLDLIDLQIDKLTTYAAVDGTVMTRAIHPGEIVQPGMIAMTLGQLADLTITVYISENQYGQISLGDIAQVKSDSFPGESFSAKVVRIADQAEYTPRNVQTEEDRATTVFAIKLSVDNPQGKLKPGMPVDVTFSE